jgi:glyoxylase-like metal-dependent hydrolase (beta-lactamase superfamily II)
VAEIELRCPQDEVDLEARPSALAASGTRPSAVVYTHAQWDHVLGGAGVAGLVIAQVSTAERLIELAERDWSDEGRDRRVAGWPPSRSPAA